MCACVCLEKFYGIDLCVAHTHTQNESTERWRDGKHFPHRNQNILSLPPLPISLSFRVSVAFSSFLFPLNYFRGNTERSRKKNTMKWIRRNGKHIQQHASVALTKTAWGKTKNKETKIDTREWVRASGACAHGTMLLYCRPFIYNFGSWIHPPGNGYRVTKVNDDAFHLLLIHYAMRRLYDRIMPLHITEYDGNQRAQCLLITVCFAETKTSALFLGKEWKPEEQQSATQAQSWWKWCYCMTVAIRLRKSIIARIISLNINEACFWLRMVVSTTPSRAWVAQIQILLIN